VDETATGSANFFWSTPRRRLCGAIRLQLEYDRSVHTPRPPSIDQGVIALVWAVGLGAFIYFGLVAVGASGATAVVIAMVSFAAIWLLVRLRGEDRPPRRRRP
jgi:hypothetical protein